MILKTAEWTLAKVREHARAGVMIDAFADPVFCLALVQNMAKGTTLPFAGGELRFEARGPLPELPAPDLQNVRHVGTEPTNTNIVIDESLFMKAYRRAEPGPNPDLEMSQLLTDAGFKAIAPMLGHIVWEDETPTLLVSLFSYVRNQGDVWNYALNHLERHASSDLVAGRERARGAACVVHDADADLGSTHRRDAYDSVALERCGVRAGAHSLAGSVELV